MSERSFSVALPASFIANRAFPSANELAYGFIEGFLGREEVVALAVAKMEAGMSLTPAEERLALLLSDELHLVDDVVDDLRVGGESSERRARFWLLMVLAWILEHRSEFDDPLAVIELVYSDFDYPDEIRGLVRFMPLQPGHEAGLAALERRWMEYVARVSREYLGRNAP